MHNYKYTSVFLFLFFLGFIQNGLCQSDSIPSLEEKVSELEEEEILQSVEKMPAWKGCENEKDAITCTHQKIARFFQKHMVYPEIARESNMQGVVYVGFVVNKKGGVERVDVLRGVSPSLDKAAIDLIKKFPDFVPAEQDGKAVAVRYSLPVRYVLS